MNNINCNKIPPFKGWVLENFPFIEADFDAITNYQLICKVIEYLNNIINNENIQNGAILQLKEELEQLKIEIQPLVNEKLDEMAEDGTLENLINTRVNLITVYNTYTEMISDENLANGLKTRTLGYYSLNDGGGCEYYVSTSVPNNIYYINIDDTFYLIPIFKDSVNVLALGFDKTGTNDNTSLWQDLLQVITLDEINNVIFPEGVYYQESSIMLENLSNITFNCYGKFKIKSQESSKYAFDLRYCNNITFNGFNLESERNQIENPPTGHTRVNSNGSNVNGFGSRYCNDITYNNTTFKNMASDFVNMALTGEDPDLRSNRIRINGWYSTHASMPLYVSTINNLYIDNAYVISEEEMGSGDHILYCSANVNGVFVNNSYFEAGDVNFGVLINFINSNAPSNDNSPKNLVVNNSVLLGRSLISLFYNSNCEFNNCTYRALFSDDTNDVLICNSGTPTFVLRNCRIYNDSNSFLLVLDSDTTGGKFEFINCYLKNASQTKGLISTQGNTNTKLDVVNCEIHCDSVVIYNTGTNCEYNFVDNKVYQAQTSNYMLANKRDTTIFNVLRNIVYNSVSKTNFIYNGGSASNNTRVYNNVISGYTKVANDTDIATINNDDNYFVSIYVPSE